MINKYIKLYKTFEEEIFNISKELIKNVCDDLDKSEYSSELIKKYLYKSKKEKKCPNNIKRAKTSYMFFLEEVRPKISKKYPNDKIGDISKRIGKLWQNLNEKDKNKYIKLANKDKERYKKELDKNDKILDATELEKSHTLLNLDETNTKIETDLFSSDNSSDNSSNFNSSESSDSVNFSDEESDDSEIDLSTKEFSTNNKIVELKKK